MALAFPGTVGGRGSAASARTPWRPATRRKPTSAWKVW